MPDWDKSMKNLYWRTRNRVQLASLKATTRAVVADRLTYLSLAKLQRIERAIEQTRHVAGDLVEFGVALGGSGIMIAHGAGPDRAFRGFDVFGMIPPPTSAKDDAKSKDRYQIIASGQSEGIEGDKYYGYRDDLLSEVEAAFARHGVPVDGQRVALYKGLFEDTWEGAGIERIAFAHIDCDWYDPVTFCLNVCADRLGDSGRIVIDDYHDYAGCRTAVDEFLARRADFLMEPGANPILRKR
jgi:asparagine synthase (glutamine-hydrolysing)